MCGSPRLFGSGGGRDAARLTLATALLLATPVWTSAQSPPSPEDVLGYGLGERFTEPAEVLLYAERLADASARVRLFRYGVTGQGRDLVLLVVGREDRLEALDEVLERNARLLHPDLAPTDAERLAAEQPAIAWLSYGVHGDESSSTEAALWTAYDLAAGAPGTEGLLDSLVVVIDPMLNPDGRARYVGWYRSTRGAAPNPEPLTLEHRPPWPGGRFNHYLFDLNRDWAWSSQPETRARLAQWFRFHPQLHIDFHEMSWRSTYFFFPPTPPINPFFPDYTLQWSRYFGERLAGEFDRRGWLYYTAERFDLFYPGYGDSWPSFWGAIGMTYEQAGGGGAGLAVRRTDGSVLTLRDRAEGHRVAGLVTLRAMADRKTAMLREFAAFHREAVEGRRDILLVPGADSLAFESLVALLGRQGLRIERATRAFRAAAEPHDGYAARREFPAGTVRVPAAQPGARLAATLLESETPFDPESRHFSYDLTAWSLPYAYGVEAHAARPFREDAFQPHAGSGGSGGAPVAEGGGAVEAARAGTRPGATRASGPSQPAYGWLVHPSVEAVGPVHRYLSVGGRARALARASTFGGLEWPAGTYFLPAADSAPAWLERVGLASLAVPIPSGRAEAGLDLGSEEGLVLAPSRIAVVAGEGVSPTAYGSVWFFLERQAGIPFDPLPVDALRPDALASYDVVVLPPWEGGPLEARRPADEVREALEGWLKAGGTLVAAGASARWVAEDLAGVPVRTDTVSLEEDERRRRGLFTREERRVEEWEDAVLGVVLPTVVDPDHPLVWGVGLANRERRLFVLHREDLRFEPDPEHETAVWLPEDVRPVSGRLGERKREAIQQSGWLVSRRVGRGVAILFADDPLFRLFWRSTHLPFAQAILLGPALTR